MTKTIQCEEYGCSRVALYECKKIEYSVYDGVTVSYTFPCQQHLASIDPEWMIRELKLEEVLA